MNILITGAFGFIGTNISQSLKKVGKHTLIALDISEPQNHSYDSFISWKNLFETDRESVDIIIHLAGKAHDTKNSAEENIYFDINVGLTQKIFNHFLNSGATKFIFFSSVKAAADEVTDEYLTEEVTPNPQTPYGKSKLEAEKYLLGQSLPTGKKIYILRPCMIHGPGNKGNLNLLYQLVSKGIPWPLGKFTNERSMVSIDNLIYLINEIIENNIEGGIYNIADDETVSTNRLIALIAESRKAKGRIWMVNKPMVKAIAKIGDILHLPLNSERLKKLTESYVVSNKKIKNALGIEKMPIGAEEGMRKTLSSFNE